MSASRFFNFNIVAALSVAVFLPNTGLCGKPIADNHSSKPATYQIDLSRIDTPKDFNTFLDRCALAERAALMQSLMGLGGWKVERHHFGKLKGLQPWDAYADKEKKATPGKPLRPKTFNDDASATVVDAIERGILPEECVSAGVIRRELQWVCFSKLKYHFMSHKRVDYHEEALRWVCGKYGMPTAQVEALPTFFLERKFLERYFEIIWDGLTKEQRSELLDKIEKNTGKPIANKAGIVAATGGGAVAALGATVAFSGFAFYTTMTTAMATAAGWAGVTLSFSTYATATSTVGFLAGPVGWVTAAASLTGGTILAAWPDSQKTANFIITTHLIKAEWAKADGVSL